MNISGKQRAVFLDRDGTINVEKDYLYKTRDFEFIPGAINSIKRLNEAGFLVVVVTNQSGVGRGYYSEADVDNLHRHLLQELLRFGASVDGFYFCPHHPTKGGGQYKVVCACRKGRPGMLLQAAYEHNIDLENSYMIGDKLADIEAGSSAGCQPILVLTGYGQKTAMDSALNDVPKCADINTAVEYILQELD